MRSFMLTIFTGTTNYLMKINFGLVSFFSDMYLV